MAMLVLGSVSACASPPAHTAVRRTIEARPAERAVSSSLPAPVIVLEEATRLADVRSCVRTFLGAFEREDHREIANLLTDDASGIGSSQSRAELLSDIRSRFARLDYRRASIVDSADFARAVVRDVGDAPSVSSDLSKFRPGDVYVELPILVPDDTQSKERLFHDLLLFIVRRDGRGQLRVAGFGETDRG